MQGGVTSSISTPIGGSWFITATSPGSVTLAYLYNPPLNLNPYINISLLVLSGYSDSITASLTVGPNAPILQQIPAFASGNVVFDLTMLDVKTDITQISINIPIQNPVRGSNIFVQDMSSTILCLAENTQILMANNTLKLIQDLVREDVVKDPFSDSGHKIACILKSNFSANQKIDVAKIGKDSIYNDYPFTDTYLSGWHPILYKNKRKPAKCFQKIKGCEWYDKTINAMDILPINSNGFYSLYNLQFDHEGLFVANGLIVQAVSPWSCISPLPKDSFYDYVEKPLTTESYITDTVWDDSLITDLEN